MLSEALENPVIPGELTPADHKSLEDVLLVPYLVT